MKTSIYFWLAKRLNHLSAFFGRLKIHCEYGSKVCGARAIYYNGLTLQEKADSLDGLRNKALKFGDKVKFRLDNSWPGEGIVKATYNNVLEVELSAAYKEFDTGVILLVRHEEVINN